MGSDPSLDSEMSCSQAPGTLRFRSPISIPLIRTLFSRMSDLDDVLGTGILGMGILGIRSSTYHMLWAAAIMVAITATAILPLPAAIPNRNNPPRLKL